MTKEDYSDLSMQSVRIPHTVKQTPYNYFDDSIYQMVSGYRRTFRADMTWKDKNIILHFEGAAHKATVFFNGEELGTHSCGYTAFEFDISEKIKFGTENVIAVKLDSRESLNVPPFGFVIDYMTYGGIYRDVFIEVTEKTSVKNTFVYADVPLAFSPDLNESSVVPKAVGVFIHARINTVGDCAGCIITESLKRIAGDLPMDTVDEYADEVLLNRESALKQNTLDYHTLPVVFKGY